VAQTVARQSEIQAFSFDLTACDHVLFLEQFPNTLSPEESSLRLKQCNVCDLRANLWLCLHCGNVGCGRKQFGGEGLPGNSHALEHYNQTHHPVAVKLGSITADGKADVYCYTDDEEIIDPELSMHLENWGIRLADVIVTEKSLAEMQLDLQYKYSFNMSSSTGEPLQPVFGPGLTGLQNLGNSCYVSSIIQVCFPLFFTDFRHCLAFRNG
jgi:ubiquitin carboxyl-terminal hydrolase 5/13